MRAPGMSSISDRASLHVSSLSCRRRSMYAREPTGAPRISKPPSGTTWRGMSVVSVGGYSGTVSGRTTCAPCKAEWPSVASVLTSACTLVVDYSAVEACQRVDRELHACRQLQYGLANQGLIFSLVLLYYFTLGSYVYNCAQWQRRTPPA